MEIGYVFSSLDESYIKEQIDAIRQLGVKQILVEEDEIENLNKGDHLIVYELRSLGKSLAQLPSFFSYLDKRQIKLIVINKGKPFENIPNKQYFSMLIEVAETESFIISQRTTKGIREAKRSGRIGGRPKISKEKIEKIRYLYHSQSYTLREISNKCNVSLGTAYKYIQD